MKRIALALLFAAALWAQHAEYLTVTTRGGPVSPAHRDSHGQVVLLEATFSFGFAGTGSRYFYEVVRYTQDFSQRVSWSELKLNVTARGDPVSRLDRFDRLYLGGVTSEGKPWLSREDGWSMRFPASLAGKVADLAFDEAGDPIALLTSSGRPTLWRGDRVEGVVTASLDFGRAGDNATALSRDPRGALFATAGPSVFRIPETLTAIEYERQLGVDTQLTALTVSADGLFVTGSTLAQQPGSDVFARTKGVFLPEPPNRVAAENPIAVVVKLDPVTGTVLASTYLGASRSEEGPRDRGRRQRRLRARNDGVPRFSHDRRVPHPLRAG